MVLVIQSVHAATAESMSQDFPTPNEPIKFAIGDHDRSIHTEQHTSILASSSSRFY